MQPTQNVPLHFMKIDPSIADALKLWMAQCHGLIVQQVGSLVRRNGRGWEARVDWVTAFVPTPEYRAAHVARQEGDPYVAQVKEALAALGNPDRFLLPQLNSPHIHGRRIHAVLAYLGYERDPNPHEAQGRWYVGGKQVKGYRRKP